MSVIASCRIEAPKPLRLWLVAVCTALAGLTAPSTASAQGSEYVRYTVKSGDTLLGMAQKYFVSARSYQRVQKINRIADPRRIPVGKVLRIPRNLLKTKPAQLTVFKFSGPVFVGRTLANSTPVKVGRQIRTGDVLVTQRGGFLSLSGVSGSRVTVPSQSQLKVIRAERILLTDTLDVDFQVVKGRGSFAPPKLKRNGRYRVRTPVAVSAVRGTEYRSAYDPETGVFLTEVTEGEVALTSNAGGSEAKIPQGFGTAASENGLGELEELLPAPGVIDGTKTQTAKKLKFQLEPVEGASRYRVQVARDIDFLEVWSETVIDGLEVEMENLPDGSDFPNDRFSVRARAISASGLEGLDSVPASFRRQRLGVSATAEASPLANGFKFAWVPAGEGEMRYDFQLWKEGETSPPLINEIGLTEQSITLTNLEPGTYVWRVAVVQPGGEEFLRVWGEPKKLLVGE